MVICEEMSKLRKWLTKEGITWHDNSEELSKEFYMCRTLFFVQHNKFSVINGVGSYGGAMIGGKNRGLLELWINSKGEPQGNLTADDVIEAVKVFQKAVKA